MFAKLLIGCGLRYSIWKGVKFSYAYNNERAGPQENLLNLISPNLILCFQSLVIISRYKVLRKPISFLINYNII